MPYGFGHGPGERAIDVAGFFLSTTPVTQAFWQHVMGANPSVRPDFLCPVENVSGVISLSNAEQSVCVLAAGSWQLRADSHVMPSPRPPACSRSS